MQITSLFTLLAVAMTASALPSFETPARRGGGEGEKGADNQCTNETANVCCSGGILECVVNIAGPCNGQAYCCKEDKLKGTTLADVDLSCLKVL
ncbi:uncharacterized protein C8A04DRAFT_33105 [Dichotomopilus funicola]|uniref:Uncharacterized protein n=1 Tax=Dichotomopilus funicola TaxID=1934379 RepID=A0AAN6UUN7_9PEZI|nr:hypothetical protein C8A04DRAFT_33105 [Dichotomopilus funicola]